MDQFMHNGRLGRKSQEFSLDTLMDFSNLTPPIRKHLSNVYSLLAGAVFMAAFGVVAHLNMNIGGMGTTFAAIGVLVWLSSTPQAEVEKRTAQMLGFSFLKGCSIGPLVAAVAAIDPRIIVTAFLGTAMIFACFTLSALWAEKRLYVLLGGFLGSALSMMCLLSLINMFARSYALFNIELYAGLVIFSLFVLYDTQLIVEKARRGDKDHVMHAVDLFIDIVAIFVRLLIILSKDKKEDKRRNR